MRMDAIHEYMKTPNPSPNQKSIGILNVFMTICILLVFVFVNPWIISGNFSETISFWKTEPFSLILFFLLPLIFFSVTLFFSYTFLLKTPKKISRITFAGITIPFLFFWIGEYFFGYMFAANIYFFLSIICISVGMFFVFRQISPIVTVLFIVLTLFLAVFSILGGFEEEYCLLQASRVSHPDELVILSKNDAGPIDSHAGDKVTRSFQEHIHCHKTFELNKALLNTYLSWN